jgi:hypothetical protein
MQSNSNSVNFRQGTPLKLPHRTQFKCRHEVSPASNFINTATSGLSRRGLSILNKLLKRIFDAPWSFVGGMILNFKILGYNRK